ncbi:MAG: ABC transporter permease, partial [Candidatus Bathyarchaeota archaeon]|nr:ABC transporter permease [Candidatus Bathyarchaeota archaeon]
MILEYLKSVYRSIRANYRFHLVNTSGLIIGLICALLVLFYAKQELAYDKHHDDFDRIFRVTERISSAASVREFAATPWPLASALSQKFDQVENIGRVYKHFIKIQLTYKENSFYADNFLFAENEILNILSYNFINGDPASALERPNSIILTRSTAEMIFGEEQAYGKSLEVNGGLYEITGIIEDQTEPGHLKADFLASLNSVRDEEEMTNWLGTECYTYLKLKKDVDRSDFEILIKDIAYDYSGETIRASGNTVEFFLQEITKIHLSPALRSELAPPGNK